MVPKPKEKSQSTPSTVPEKPEAPAGWRKTLETAYNQAQKLIRAIEKKRDVAMGAAKEYFEGKLDPLRKQAQELKEKIEGYYNEHLSYRAITEFARDASQRIAREAGEISLEAHALAKEAKRAVAGKEKLPESKVKAEKAYNEIKKFFANKGNLFPLRKFINENVSIGDSRRANALFCTQVLGVDLGGTEEEKTSTAKTYIQALQSYLRYEWKGSHTPVFMGKDKKGADSADGQLGNYTANALKTYLAEAEKREPERPSPAVARASIPGHVSPSP
jgi:hypothetical protein